MQARPPERVLLGLIGAARAAGLAVMTGDGLCVHQASGAFRLFFGEAPETSVLRATMRGA